MQCIHELFESQAERTPDAVAAVFGGSGLTYRELNRRAEALADRLRLLGVGPDVLVALLLERSLEMVIGLLGVLKAGGAYVPLDPGHPRKRLAYMLADARPRVLLTQAHLRSELPPHDCQILVVDAEESAASPGRASASGQPATPDNLAYVIYTSGSTGEPKGVEIEHRAVVNLLASMRRRPGFAAEDTMLAITTLSFDIAALEIFLPLTCGARVVIAPSETVVDGVALANLIEHSGANVVQATPATLRMLLDAGWAGGPGLTVLCGGEAWTGELASQLLARCGSLWNMYGPTETTIWSSVAQIRDGQPVVLGPPIANTRFYVLDHSGQLVPVGVPGELYIGGAGLARGYWRREQLTRERFVPDPFATSPGARMYRTGDRVRRLPNSTLEFLGRLDHQVKIRGHRLELGEIEARLREHPTVEEAVVLAREDDPGEKRLVAYVTGETAVAADLRAHLMSVLPEYMVPAAYMRLDALPLTPNGKLDRNALPAPNGQAFGAHAYEAPEGPIETTIAGIWSEFLGLERIGRHDNFFELGGHSLMALRVIGNINNALKVHLHVPAFFRDPTIARLAAALRQECMDRAEPRVMQLSMGRRGLPIYLISARPEEFRLAGLLGEDRAVFAVDAPVPVEWHNALTAGRRAEIPSIEQLSAPYIDLVQAHAGSSPCVVAGYSLGGKIAFEVARALQRQNGNVALVLLVDAYPFALSGATREPGLRGLQRIWGDFTSGRSRDMTLLARSRTSLGQLWRLLRWFVARLPQSVKGRAYLVRSRLQSQARPSGYMDTDGKPVDISAVERLAHVAGRTWRPHPIDAVGVLIRAADPIEDLLPDHDPTSGWGGLFEAGLEIVQAQGDHVSMVIGDNLEALARQVIAVLIDATLPGTLARPGRVTNRTAA